MRRAVGGLLGLAIVCIFTMGASTCSSGGSGPPRFAPTFVTELTLKNAAGSVRREFALGEPITLELSVRNRGGTEAILQFPSTQEDDAVIVDGGTDRVRWRWSHDKVFLDVHTEVTFAPEETKTFTFTWEQRDNAEVPVATGSYEARGVMLFEEFATDPLFPHQLGSPLEPFTIR